MISRAQVRGCGGDDALTRRRLRAGAWLKVAPGIYALPAPASFQRRLWVGHLASGPDSLVSFEAAGAVHEFLSCPPNRVILIGAHSGWQRIDGVFVHQINDVLPHHRMTISGLPVTTRSRTIVDLAAVVRLPRLALILDDQVTHRRVSYVEVGQVLKEVARRGKPGVRKLTAVLDERGSKHVPSASVAEAQFVEALRRAGEPLPIPQYRFPGQQFTDGCVDGAYVDALLIVEVDSRTWHGRIANIKHDRDRDGESSRHGWLTRRVLAEDIVNDPEGQVGIVRDIRRRRLAQFGRLPESSSNSTQ